MFLLAGGPLPRSWGHAVSINPEHEWSIGSEAESDGKEFVAKFYDGENFIKLYSDDSKEIATYAKGDDGFIMASFLERVISCPPFPPSMSICLHFRFACDIRCLALPQESLHVSRMSLQLEQITHI